VAGLSEGGSLDVWDVASRRKIHSIPRDSVPVDRNSPDRLLTGLTFLPDGWLCLAGSDGSLTAVEVMTGHGSSVGPTRCSGRFFEFSPDGRHGVFQAPAGQLIVEDSRAGVRLLDVPHRADCLRGPSLSPDGRFLLAAGPNAVQVWSVDEGRPVLKTATRAALATCAWGLAGTRLLVADAHGAVDVFALEGLASGPPVVTAVLPSGPFGAAWLGWAGRLLGRRREPTVVFRCPWGSGLAPAPPRVVEAIADVRQRAELAAEQSPALNLPDCAFDDERLLAECPACGRPLRFNPFLVNYGLLVESAT
jgi:hypothetical protein